MPQSLAKVNIHIIFSTKHGQELIPTTINQELHSYIIGILSSNGSYTYELYANPDHIHILCTLPRTIAISSLISKIKTGSSKWLKTKQIENFYWQDGYAVFSVSASKTDIVAKYIINQPSHHKKSSYKDELREFFKEYNIDFDENYVWD